jgi:hypothetical protein
MHEVVESDQYFIQSSFFRYATILDIVTKNKI